MKNFFRIIRWPNLLMIAVIQGMVFYFLMDHMGSMLYLQEAALLIFITVVIGAAGYVINDYYDSPIDSINKPSRWIAGNSWSLPKTLKVYKVLVALGAVLSLVLAYRLEMLIYFPVYVLAVVGLQLYSVRLKCMPVVGNLWVALFCGGVVLIMAVPDLIKGTPDIVYPSFWPYVLFAMLTTLYREVIKDLEDVHGDREYGCKTFIVRFGERAGKFYAFLVAILLWLSLYWWEGLHDSHYAAAGLWIIQTAVIVSMFLIWRAHDYAVFRKASIMVKIIMVAGTLLLLLP
jgi:4-hydroxybenzoate polyprenyltransferase